MGLCDTDRKRLIGLSTRKVHFDETKLASSSWCVVFFSVVIPLQTILETTAKIHSN